MPRTRVFPVMLACAALACAPDGGPERPEAVRETLADGTVVVRYAALPAAVDTLRPDLVIGGDESDPDLVFGDVRGVDADREGNVYVLDAQAAEVRAFDAQGAFLRAVAPRGEGPGEVLQPTGIIVIGDSILWIEDPSRLVMIAVDLDGGERTRVPMPVLSFGYVWDGTVDDAGRIWKSASHGADDDGAPPEEGLNEGTWRSYRKSLDPATGALDSVYVGDAHGRTLVVRRGTGRTHLGIPYDPALHTLVDPSGGFWVVSDGRYAVARLDASGDTTLVLEVAAEPMPVTAEDRSGFVARMSASRPELLRAAEEVAALMAETKPVIAGLFMDDAGGLWVERTVPDGETRLFDVFERDGTHRATYRLGFRSSAYIEPRIRHGALYALQLDDLDVPTVVRAPIP